MDSFKFHCIYGVNLWVILQFQITDYLWMEILSLWAILVTLVPVETQNMKLNRKSLGYSTQTGLLLQYHSYH